MDDIKIFVSYPIDKDHELINHSLYIPVRCGAMFDSRKNIKIAGDNTGVNISDKWMFYGDLTVLYWAWKNADLDFYGFCNFKKYFAFPFDKQHEDKYGNIICEYMDEKTINGLGLKATKRICQEIVPYDIVLPCAFNIRNSNKKFKNIFQYYDFVRGKNTDDLEKILLIIGSLFPDYLEDARSYFNGQNLFFSSLFVMRREIFSEFCAWLFHILEEYEKQASCIYDNIDEIRSVYQIGEIMLGIFYIHLLRTKPRTKTHNLQQVLIQNTTCNLPPEPYFPENNIPIVLASSEFFLPYAAVTIQSIIENNSQEYNYDITLLNTGYPEQAIKLLKSMASEHKNISIRLLNIGPYVSRLKFNTVGHVSKETFYRLLVPELFQNYQKIIYLDSDLIVCEDIANLYNINMGNNLLAAVYDADFIGEYNGASPAMKIYCDEILGLENPYSYFQAGVLVFNILSIKNTFRKNELIEFASGKKLNFVDQDVLNCKCSGRVFFLDMRWNVVTDCGGYRINMFIRRAPYKIYQEYMRSREEPKIIHYSGFEKPWTNKYSDMANIYWGYARKCTFYETIISRMLDYDIHGLSNNTLGRCIKDFCKQILNPFFPKNTMRREELKKIFYRLFRHT